MTLTPTGPCGARSSGPRPEDGKSRCNASPYSSTPAKLVALHEQPRRRLSKLCCITLFFSPLRVCATAESPLVSLPCVCLTPHPRSSSERPPSLFRWHGGLTEPPPACPTGLARISPASSRGHMDPPPCTRKRIVCLPDRNARSGAGGRGGGRVAQVDSAAGRGPRGRARFRGSGARPKAEKRRRKKRQEWTQHVNNPT